MATPSDLVDGFEIPNSTDAGPQGFISPERTIPKSPNKGSVERHAVRPAKLLKQSSTRCKGPCRGNEIIQDSRG